MGAFQADCRTVAYLYSIKLGTMTMQHLLVLLEHLVSV